MSGGPSPVDSLALLRLLLALLTLLAMAAAGAAAALLVPGRRIDLPAVSAWVDSDPTGERHPPPARETWLIRGGATLGTGLGAAFLVGGAPGLAVGVLVAAGCWWVTGRLEPPSVRRRREALVSAVPHAVDLLAACLAAGLSPSAAVEQVAAVVDEPLAQELAAPVARLRMGVDPATVWRDLCRHPQLGGLGRTIARAVESGASVAEAMLRLAEDQRRLNRAAVESRARAVGVKAALPLGVCLLPAFLLVGVVPLVAGSLPVLAP